MHTLAEAQAFIDAWLHDGPPALPSVSDLSLDELKTAAQLACDQEQWDFGKHYLLELLARGHEPAQTCANLGRLHADAGTPHESLAWYRKALDLDPTRRGDHDHLIFLLDAQPETTDAEAIAERRRYFAMHGRTAYDRRLPLAVDADPDRPLRVGYLSGDWNFHSVGLAFAPVLMHHSASIIPYVYSSLHPAHHDAVTRQTWQPIFGDRFLECYGLNASQLAAVIRHDQIDILVDLAGYTARNRLLTFAHRPAPIQIQAWGYVLGTAAPDIDAVFVDQVVAAGGMEQRLGQRLVQLPSMLGFHPREGLPTPSPLPCLTNAPKFCVHQRASKTNAATYRVWRQILERVSDSTLTFKGPDYSPAQRIRIVDAFGPYASQISFAASSGQREHLEAYDAMDLSLDPWPQTGGVSSLESLWMGVPMVTLTGERMIARTSASILTNCGFVECITETEQEYINEAVALVTTRRARLAEMRATARERMQASPIMMGYVEAVEAAYRELWREYCAVDAKDKVA